MAEDIVANELSAKKITSEDITVNDIDIVEYIKSKIAEVELDPVFKKWLETDSRLSDIGKNEISDYAKANDIPADLSDLTGKIDKSKISNFGSYLSSNVTLSDINNNEISDYALKSDLSSADDISADLVSKGAKFTDTTYTADDFKDNFLSVSDKITDYTTSANVSSIVEGYDFAKASDIPTADSFKDNFLSSSIKLSAVNDNEISNYALSADVDKAIEEKSLAPDAHLNLTDNENLRILSSDGQVLWQSASAVRYSIVAQTSALADMTITPYALTSASTAFQLPTSQAVAGKARDFLLDLSNSTDADASIEFDGLDTAYSILVDSSTTRTDETTFKSGEHAIVAFTEIASNGSMPCYLMCKKTIHDKES